MCQKIIILESPGKANSKLQVMVATATFSMGDCPDIKQAIHYGTLSVPEQYVQEIGRAAKWSAINNNFVFWYIKAMLKIP